MKEYKYTTLKLESCSHYWYRVWHDNDFWSMSFGEVDTFHFLGQVVAYHHLGDGWFEPIRYVYDPYGLPTLKVN